VNSLVMIAMCSAAIGASDGESYADAHQASMKSGKPMLVMVSTEWCPACQVMKRRILPQIRERGLLKRVAFASVNPDQEGELSRQLIGGGPIPQLVMYRKTPRGWTRRAMVGSQSVESVEQFINQGTVADDDEEKKVDLNDTKPSDAPKPPAEAKPAEKSKQPTA
jgi:thiol-disulfide isomerase/thioredoxin